MIIKTIVIVAFFLIILSLGSALYHLMRPADQAHSEKTVQALTFRIGLSVVLFILIFIAYAMDLIQPTGIGTKIHHFPNKSAQIAP